MSAHGITLTGYCARWASGLVVEPLGTWDSTGQETLAIETASDGWQGVITATFWGPSQAEGTDMLMDGGTCIVPPEALAAPGNGTITLRCTNAAGRRISVDLAYHSAGHAQVPGSPSTPTPDLWQQYVEQVAADADRAEQASKDAAGSAAAAAKSAEQAAQATADIGDAKDDALEAIQQAHQAALDDIATDRQQALTDIETEGEKQTSAITSSGAAALEAIGQVEQTAIGQVQQAGTTQVSAVQQAGQAQQTAIEQAGQSWQQQISAAGTAELGRWAPAIWDTAPLAAEHDIYAAEGAPLRVTQQGKTEQETTKGAQLLSDDDIHMTQTAFLSFSGLAAGEYALSFTSSADWWTGNENGKMWFVHDGNSGEVIAYLTFADAAVGGRSSAGFSVPEGTASIIVYTYSLKTNKSVTDIMLNAGSTALPWEPYTGGAPSPSPDYPQAIEGIDSPVTAQTSDGQTTTSISMDIGSPLYGDGNVADTVANDVPSGCDKAIVLDGSEDEDWGVYATAAGGNRAIFLQGAPDMAMDADDNAVMAYSDRLPVVLAGDINNGTVGVGLYRGNIYIYVPGITDVAGFRAALTANPLKIWYRSTAYTEAADLHIDKTTRRWRMAELDGTELGSRVAASGGGSPYYYQMSDAKFSGGLATSIPGWGDATKSTHFLSGNAYAEKGNLAAVMTHSGVSSCRLGFDPDPFASYQEMQSWLAAQKSAGTPVRVLYQLATPEEYASDPHTLPALGSLPETVKATGQSTVEYSADTKHYIDAKFAALSAAMLGG